MLTISEQEGSFKLWEIYMKAKTNWTKVLNFTQELWNSFDRQLAIVITGRQTSVTNWQVITYVCENMRKRGA
jgi:hypothetical protein